MEEIARRADVNKALLYYYYSTKENLYREVLGRVMTRNFLAMFTALEERILPLGDLSERVAELSRTFFSIFTGNPRYTKILFEALTHEPETVTRIVRELKTENAIVRPDRVLEIFRSAQARGECRNIEPRQIAISIIGMNLIYFLTKPISQVLLEIDVEDETAFLEKREQSIIDLLLNGIVQEAGGVSADGTGREPAQDGDDEPPEDDDNRPPGQQEE